MSAPQVLLLQEQCSAEVAAINTICTPVHPSRTPPPKKKILEPGKVGCRATVLGRASALSVHYRHHGHYHSESQTLPSVKTHLSPCHVHQLVLQQE